MGIFGYFDVKSEYEVIFSQKVDSTVFCNCTTPKIYKTFCRASYQWKIEQTINILLLFLFNLNLKNNLVLIVRGYW